MSKPADNSLAAAVRAARGSGDFEDHLGRSNRRRIGLAGGYCVWIFSGLLAINLLLPSLRIGSLMAAQIASILWALSLKITAQRCMPNGRRTSYSWLLYLFGGGSCLAGMAYNLTLDSYVGGNPAYVTGIFLCCLVPIWPPALLLPLLGGFHLLYLCLVWTLAQQHGLVLTIGGTAAALLAAIVAMLQYRSERLNYDTALVIRQKNIALAEALDRQQSLIKEREELIAITAHDLKSPLSGIRALLRQCAESGEAERRIILAEVAAACGAMHSLVSEIVEVHALDSAAEPPLLIPIDAGEMARKAVNDLAPLAEDKRIHLDVAFSQCQVLADAAGLASILNNLISNAIKYAPCDSAVGILAEPAGKFVRIAVTDQGPGVLPNERARLFQKFGKTSNRPTGGESSTGLGLCIVRRLAEQMGGRVGYEPGRGGGSLFYVELKTGIT